jgi:hypothetical protein
MKLCTREQVLTSVLQSSDFGGCLASQVVDARCSDGSRCSRNTSAPDGPCLPCPAITKRAIEQAAGVCECGAPGSPEDSPIATRVTTEGTTAAPSEAGLASWVIPVAVIAGLLVLIIAVILVVFFMIMHRKRTGVQAGPGTQKPARIVQPANAAAMPARSGDNEYPGLKSHYAATAAKFKAGIPQGSNYTNIPKEPYAVTAADFKAGVSRASNYSEMPEY